jgi:hypothetical protein
MSWMQFASGAALIAGCVTLFVWGPSDASTVAAGLGGGAAVVLGGGVAKRGPS